MTLARRLMYEPAPTLRGLLLVAATVVVLVTAVGGLFYPRYIVNSDVPTPVTTVAPAGDAGAIVTSDSTSGVGGGARGCLTTIRRGPSSIEICWQAYRLLSEADVAQDYYGLEVTATAHGAEAGIKWAVVQAHPATGAASFSSGIAQEISLAPGHCLAVAASDISLPVGPGTQRMVLACEHWRSETLTHQGQQDDARITWDCGSCLSGIVGDRDVSLVQVVVTNAGIVPSWELSADIGG